MADKLTNKTADQSALSLTSAEHVEGQAKSPAYLNALEWRLAGPHRGGRVVAVAGDPHNRQVFYFGSTGGGVWKTTDGGVYWENVSDGFFKRASVGALAVAPSDPNVIYAGMGESTIRGNVSHGDGKPPLRLIVLRGGDEPEYRHVPGKVRLPPYRGVPRPQPRWEIVQPRIEREVIVRLAHHGQD